jgi:predicted O-methyltransferase YrrM
MARIFQNDLELKPEITDSRFQMVDDGAVEQETGELLYAFIRRLKPENVLETGTYTGISSLYMAQALKDNGFGHMWSVEFEQFHIDRANKLWQEQGVSTQITSIKADSREFKPDKQYQFMFLDTELNLRFGELVRFYDNLDEGGYIFVHDMPRSLCQGNFNPDHPEIPNWPVGELPEQFKYLVKSGKLKSMYFPGARGLVGFYKPHKDDFI